MKKLIALGVVCTGLVHSVVADIIFDNSANDSNVRFNPGVLEIGDEILLAGQQRYLTNFAFEYWGTNSAGPGNPLFGGSVQARVRFYRNDGPMFNGYASPGTSFWDSGWFNIFPTVRNVLVFTAGLDFPASGLYLSSSDMTWSVQFRGMNPMDAVGVDFYSPQTVGGGFPDYWENNDGWCLRTNNIGPANFAARLEATLVPAPAEPFIQIMASGSQAILAWPGWATNFTLETSGTLGPGATWSSIGGTPQWIDNNFILTTPTQPGPAFFRLHWR